jgi:hypothetical protein
MNRTRIRRRLVRAAPLIQVVLDFRPIKQAGKQVLVRPVGHLTLYRAPFRGELPPAVARPMSLFVPYRFRKRNRVRAQGLQALDRPAAQAP